MRRCPSCGEENDERARFCWSCGGSLDVKRAPTSEERKVVSVLFVDLVGFTARSDQSDPEDVRATLRVYHERLKREIERFGGTVEKFVGDAVMAVFGAPVAHEDDAERAVRASLRIAEAIEELNEERPGLDLAIRAAVNTGEAVVTLGARPEAGEGFVTGDVVNVASRLQGIAPVGGVVVGELTYRATRGVIEYEELDPVSVKGKEEALPVWRAVEARSRFGVDVEQQTQVPLIGRDRELNLLRELFGGIERDATAQLVTLVGEPGVGKSRLVWEFQRFVDDLPDIVYWRQGRCLPYGEGITFWALGEVVKSHAGILESDTPEQAASKLDLAVSEIVDEEGERDWIRSRLEPLVGLSEEAQTAEREESFTAWRTFLEAIASTRALVLVFEDLHWADPAMLAFVEHLADWASGVPLFVLCTARPELYERDPSWGGGKRNHTAVSLSPLTSDETAQLIGALLDRTVLPAETQTALLARAGGNPLYAEEFIRMLVDRGVLARSGASWELTSGEDEIPVPETVQALIAARLDTLSPERKALLQDAAVIGKVFWAGALAEMGGIDPRQVREGLHDLARKELLRPARRPSIEGETEYAFWHLLVRDVAYGQIPRASRADKHQAAAVWIEKIAGERLADSSELLAYHYEQALELARAVGVDTGEVEKEAFRFLMLAAERALRLDVSKASVYFERALALTRPGDPNRFAALMLGGHLAVSGGASGERADELLTEAATEARAMGDQPGEAAALAWLSRNAWQQGDTARQTELIAAAMRIMEGRPGSAELANVLSRLVASHGLAGRSAQAIAASEEALPLVREFGSETDLAVVLQMRGQARTDMGDVEGGFADLREGLRIALESSPAGFTAAAHVNLGDNVWFAEGPEKGQALYEAGAEIGDRRGAARHADWARMQTMWTSYDLGAWDSLLDVGQGILNREIERGSGAGTQLTVLTDTYRRDVLLHRGVPNADERIEEALLPRAREIGDGQVVVPAFRVAALARGDHGDVAGALALVEELDELLRGRIGFRSWLLDWASRVCLAAGAVELLRSLVEQGIQNMTRNVNSLTAGRAVLAELEGDLPTSLKGYDDAATRWGTFPSILETGHALAGAGRSLLGLGRANEAADRFRSARDRYRSLQAAPLVAEMDSMLARATAKTS
ncbi:MAG: adenylate/guanylate cyclase domain-containing protein [Actinomycetota bacterium]